MVTIGTEQIKTGDVVMINEYTRGGLESHGPYLVIGKEKDSGLWNIKQVGKNINSWYDEVFFQIYTKSGTSIESFLKLDEDEIALLKMNQ
jgi:hypothetical protein